jgi:hypothetical protein
LSRRFHEWLLARSTHLEVIAPRSLRAAIRKDLTDALTLYA